MGLPIERSLGAEEEALRPVTGVALAEIGDGTEEIVDVERPLKDRV